MTYFIRINEPRALRRLILEASKEIIHTLKGYHLLLDIRDGKRELADQLRRNLSALNKLVGELERLLPEKSLKEVEAFLPPPVKERRKKSRAVKSAKSAEGEKAKGAKTAPKKKLSEVERLDHQLNEIEQRLQTL